MSRPGSYKKAFGPYQQHTPAQKARDVAASILSHNLNMAHEDVVWARYGLQANPAQQQLVWEALAQLIRHGV